MKKFRTYQLAVQFYKLGRSINLPRHLKDQFLRASSSIVLNLAEGSAKSSQADRRKFYEISLASTKECQAILELESNEELSRLLDTLAAHSYRLVQSLKS